MGLPTQAHIGMWAAASRAAPPGTFMGRAVLLEKQRQLLRKKLIMLVPDAGDAYLWGGETILIDGEPVGDISSAGWSIKAGACVAMGYVRGAAAAVDHQGTAAQIELWGRQVATRLYERWTPAL